MQRLDDSLDLHVSRETRGKLEHFIDIFQKWSRRINLIAPSTREDLWSRHILDSAQLFKMGKGAKNWLDLGSGGGFPGVVLAILLCDQEQGFINLVESNHKKAAFLRTALMETGARGSVNACRIEDAADRNLPADIVSARALAALDSLLQLSAPWLENRPKARALFHKGRDYAAELDKARDHWQFDLVIHKSVIELDSVVLEIGGLTRKI
ncbi:16S rRNA (guanine(527)-N(7))-methyltransferase RsmG [Rhizobium halophytocola]|uniref:Ribosomal RNA small subunit methyltransferase G n=1 Tax=Rhizobium halophytocola TaxID=735519 RepID=A0ABS4E1Q5_9HYPH|nr:16S rRNA (guanine(527)-N(7))-methyltransferase RsmG [Rhizobium halophytocola]MBP1851856.1 16S rRNA (guanine527-N7)-methyltransferase [Rhizobium halophytocola]